MAQNEQINIDLIINASQSAKTIKEQKQSLKEVRDALDNVKQGSGAFELLTDEANRLASTMDNLTLSFEDVYGSGVQPLTTQLGELEDRMYALAIAGQKDTEEFRNLQAEAVKMRKTIIDVDETVDAFAQKGAKLKGFIQVAEGIAGGFAVAQGALALFGDENEEVEKAILKVQGAMALLQGVQALSTTLTEKNALFTIFNTTSKVANTTATAANTTAIVAETEATAGATIATRIWNTVLKANPLFLFVAVISAVVGAIYLFSKATGGATKATEALNKALQFQLTVLQFQKDAALQAAQSRIALAEASGKSEKEITKLKLNELNLREAADKKELANLTKQLATQKKLRSNYVFDGEDEKVKETQTTIDELNKQKDALEVNLRNQEGLGNSYQIQRKVLNLNTNKAITESNNKVSTDYNKNLKDDTKNTKEELAKREEAQKDYNDTIADLNKQASDLNKQYRLIGEDETITSFEKLKIQYELDNTNYLENEKDKIEKQKVYLKDGVINQDEYTKRVSEIEDLSLNIRNSRFKIFYFNQLALESNYKDEVIKSYLEINKSDLDNKLQQINAQEKLEKTRLKIKFDADKKEVANTVLTAQEKINELTKAEETKKKLITTYQNEIAKSEIVLKNARDIKTRQDAASDIETYKGKIEQGKLEIEANKQLINEKKLLIDVNNKLYGNAAQMTAQDYFINNLVVEQDAFAQRINLLTTYYANQKDLIEDNRKIEELNTTSSINDLTDSLKEKQELQKDLNAEILILQNDLTKAITDAEKKVIDDKLELKARELDDNENFINQIITAQQVANVKKLKEDQKYESDLLALKAGTIDSLEGFDLTELANLKEKHLKEIEELNKQKDKYVDYEKSLSEIKIKQAKETAVVIETITGDSTKKLSTFTKDELENTADFVVALVNEISSLFNQINQNFVDGSVTQIEFEKEEALKAYDERIKAYEDMTSSMSNADRLKADKDNQIRLERERLENEYDEKRKEAEYQGALRSWKMSIAQAVVDAAAFVLKAGAQTGFFGAPAAIILGALQVGTILSNPPQKLATGGYVSGEGGPTDDKIPAMLSNGEFVINAAATAKNLPLLNMINNGASPMTPSLPKFATGGYVNVVNNNNVDNSEIIRIFQEYMSQPIKAYVVSNDVTQQQNKDNRLKSRTSF